MVCIIIGVFLYDFGKIGIFDVVLGKKLWLDEVEYVVIRMYFEIGYCMLVGYLLVVLVEEVVLLYYEILDGCGYFFGWCGEDILLVVCIVGICDVFDVMISMCFYCSGMLIV